MSISSTLWWVLAATIPVGISIAIGAYAWYRLKVKKIKEEYAKQEKIALTTIDKALQRKNPGELLWELKNKSKNPLDDQQMEFLINTCWRNSFKTFAIFNAQSDYEKKSLTELGNVKESNLKPDLTIIFPTNNFNDDFDKSYKSLSEKKIIALVNANNKHKEIKNFLKYLKLIDAKYDFSQIGKGIILIVR